MPSDNSSIKLAVIPGDGIGTEVTAEALKVLEVAAPAELKFARTQYDLGAERYLATGEVLPESVLEEIRGQDAILRPYAERYVEVVPELWRTRSPQLAGSLTQRLFPSTLVEPDVLSLVRTLLDGDELPAAGRRVVLECQDDLRRALHAQGRLPG